MPYSGKAKADTCKAEKCACVSRTTGQTDTGTESFKQKKAKKSARTKSVDVENGIPVYGACMEVVRSWVNVHL